MAKGDKPILGYWNIRGFVQPSRFLLEHAGADYEEKIYDVNKTDEWYSVKFNLDLDFPNLPYYKDGDVKLTQSMAILRHLARKHGMAPKTDKEYARADMVAMQMTDMWTEFMLLCYGDKFAETKSDFADGLPRRFEFLDKFLGDNSWFGAGEGPTFVDFQTYEVLYQLRKFAPNCLDSRDKLLSFMERFETLPRIAKYMKSDRFISGPIWSPQAKWED